MHITVTNPALFDGVQAREHDLRMGEDETIGNLWHAVGRLARIYRSKGWNMTTVKDVLRVKCKYAVEHYTVQLADLLDKEIKDDAYIDTAN